MRTGRPVIRYTTSKGVKYVCGFCKEDVEINNSIPDKCPSCNKNIESRIKNG